MPRKKVPQKDVPALLTELGEAGATDIRRSDIDVRGLVTVRWKKSSEEIQQDKADLRAWIPVYVLTAIFIVIVIVTMLIVT